MNSPDQSDVCQEILINGAGSVWANNLVVTHQDDSKVGGVFRDRFCNGVNHVGIDRGHCQVDDFDSPRGQRGPELGREQPVKAVVLVREALRGRSPQDVNPEQIRATLFGEGVLKRTDI